MRSRAIVAIVLLLALVASTACGARARGGYYYVETTPTHTFSLTLVNDTSVVLTPGIVAWPGDVVYTATSIPPGGSAIVVVDFVPQSIVIDATGTAYVYPTHTLAVGVDYYTDSTGFTFFYTSSP